MKNPHKPNNYDILRVIELNTDTFRFFKLLKDFNKLLYLWLVICLIF